MSAQSTDYAAYRIKELGLNTPLGLLGPLIIGAMFSALLFVVENPAIMVSGTVSATTCNDYFDCYHCAAPQNNQSLSYYYDIPGWPGQETVNGNADAEPLWKIIGEGGNNPTAMYLMLNADYPGTSTPDPYAIQTWQKQFQYHGCPCDDPQPTVSKSMPYINAVRR
jgi:hypothetical protein